MKINLKDFELAKSVKSVETVELDKDKTYLVLVNTVGMNYTDATLESLKQVSDAFQQTGIKSIILLNPYNGGRPEFVIGQNKEIGA